jgi:tetratricopeptide (TPR) repeat protein
MRDNPELLAVYGRALLMLRRPQEAVDVCQRVVRTLPNSGAAELELAMALEDAGRCTAAETAARNALIKGFDAPETHFALGNALLKQGRLDEAEAAFRHAITLRSDYAAAHYNLAQIIWMRRSDLGAAVATLDVSLRSAPVAADLLVVKAKLLEYAGDIKGALAILKEAIARGATDPRLHLAAAEAALRFDSAQAAEWARRTLALQPGNARALATLGDAQLGLGRPREALCIVDDLLKLDPNDGRAIALQATAWRLLDEPRYRELYNYLEFVRAWTIDTPAGWPDLASYLADLARSLRGLHRPLQTHPIEQSLRHGTQSNQDLMHSDDPAIRAFFQAVDGPIRRHLGAIGTGTDAHRRRNNGRYRISGAWSVRLQPNGYHVDHLHPQGWLSSACHIHIPEAVRRGGHEGWIKFGEPGVPTIPSLAAERYEQPEPGKLVLFPSYMWHGTVPFSGSDMDERLTIAFDVVPA